MSDTDKNIRQPGNQDQSIKYIAARRWHLAHLGRSGQVWAPSIANEPDRTKITLWTSSPWLWNNLLTHARGTGLG